MSFAQEERARLAEQLEIVGPDAPTLCEGWNTKDLLVHLCLRERRPDAVTAAHLPHGQKYADHVKQTYEKKSYEELLKIFRSGPPLYSYFKLLDVVANTPEMFVHLEDVRRAQGGQATTVPGPGEWFPRVFDTDTNNRFWKVLCGMAPILLEPNTAPVRFKWRGRNGIVKTFNNPRSDKPLVTVCGPPGEMLLWLFGRKPVSLLIDGDENSVIRRSI